MTTVHHSELNYWKNEIELMEETDIETEEFQIASLMNSLEHTLLVLTLCFTMPFMIETLKRRKSYIEILQDWGLNTARRGCLDR